MASRVAHGLHELKTHQRVMHYSGRAIMSESHKIGRNWIVYLMERCNIVKVLRYKTEKMRIELQILFHSFLLLSNRLYANKHFSAVQFYLELNNIVSNNSQIALFTQEQWMYQRRRRINNSIILILLRTRVRLSLIDFLSNMLLFYVLYKSYVRSACFAEQLFRKYVKKHPE